jgi:predicted 3-demethylubiquinone-9 3-methyltransferase (glyoxalase superfamily)
VGEICLARIPTGWYCVRASATSARPSGEDSHMAHNIRTCLWFDDGRGPEAAAFYCALVPNSRVESSFVASTDVGRFSVTNFVLGGAPYQILDAGPHFKLTEAVSISVETDDQAQSDRLWYALTADGGQESACGWLKDRFGVSWQVFPRRLTDLTMSKDPKVAAAATAEMMKQSKIDMAAIEAAVAAVSG